MFYRIMKDIGLLIIHLLVAVFVTSRLDIVVAQQDFKYTALSLVFNGGMSNGGEYLLRGTVSMTTDVYIETKKDNFDSTIYCSEYDIKTAVPPVPLPATGFPVTFIPRFAAYWGMERNAKAKRRIQVKIVVPSDPVNCEKCVFLCVYSATPPINDPNLRNNWACQKPPISCDYNIVNAGFTPPPTIYEWKTVTTPYYIDVTCDKPIAATSGVKTNFRVKNFFAGSLTPACKTAGKTLWDNCPALAGSPAITTTIETAQRQKAIVVGKTTRLTGTIVYPKLAPGSVCNTKQLFVCSIIVAAEGADGAVWKETPINEANNIVCKEVTSRQCQSDPMVDKPTLDKVCIVKSRATTLEFGFDVTNKARKAEITNKEYTNIPASKGTNFAVDAILTNADTVPPTAATTLYTIPLVTTPNLSGKLDTDATTATKGKANNVVITKCQDLKHACFFLKEGTTPMYSDINPDNNYTCTKDATLFDSKKSCDPDVELTIDALTAKTLKGDTAGVSDGYPVNLNLDFSWANVAINTKPSDGNNIIQCDKENLYKAYYYIVSEDLTATRSPTACDTISKNGKELTSIPVASLQKPLKAGDPKIIVTGNAELTNIQLTPESCVTPKFVCICVMDDPASGWIDAKLDNNYNCIKIPQDCGPSLGNLGNATCVYENATADSIVFDIEASDPGKPPDPLIWHWYVSPMDGSFVMTHADDKKQGATIKISKNHKLDYETIKEYKLHVLVTDEKNKGVTGTLTICIKDYNERPKITNLPDVVIVPENQLHQASVFQLYVTDEENDAIELKILESKPPDGMSKFFINSNGVISVNKSAGIDYEYLWDNFRPDPQYKLNISACDLYGCTTKILTVMILDVNEPPLFSPDKSNYFELKELPRRAGNSPPCPYRAKIYQIQPAWDWDEFGKSRDSLSYSLREKSYMDKYYKQSTTDPMIICEGPSYIDYESTILPRIFYIDVLVSDSGFQNQGDKKGIVPLEDVYQLKVHVQNQCESPYLINPGTVSVSEDSPSGTTVVPKITGVDRDLWIYGDFWFSVDPNSDASKYFETKRLTRDTAALILKSPIDCELFDKISVPVRVIDYCEMKTVLTLKITVLNVNDNAPIFSQTLYNWEVSTTASIGTHLGQVSATDADRAPTKITYEKLFHAEMFAMTSDTGNVTTLQTPMLKYHKYVQYTVASDNDASKPLKSMVGTIRIDTYVECEVLSSWYTADAPSVFTDAKINNFLANLTNICRPCLAKLHNATESNGKAVMDVYFLKDASTDLLGNIGRAKEFIRVDSVMSEVSGVTLSDYGVTKVLKTCPDPEAVMVCNWILCTIEGNCMLGFLLSVALASWLALLTWIGMRCFPLNDRFGQRVDTPFLKDGDLDKKSKKSNLVHPSPPEGDLQVLDFRYADRPTVARKFLPESQGN